MTSSIYRPTKLFRYLLWGQASLTLIVPLGISWVIWMLFDIGSSSFWQNPIYTPLQQIKKIGWQTALLLLALYVGAFISFLYAYHTNKKMRLELSSEGIALHQLGLRQFARWENVKALKQFLLRREVVLSNVESHGTLSFIQSLVREKRFLLTPFIYGWDYSDLKKDLEHYAPQLFDSH